MFLGPGEILERGAEGFGREQPHVHLHVIRELHADLVFALDQHLSNTGELDEVVSGASEVAARNQQVEVAHGLAAAAQRARRLDALDAFDLADIGRKLLGRVVGGVQPEASRGALKDFEGFQDVLLRFFVHPRQFPQSPGLGCGPELVERLDAELAVKQASLLRPDALHLNDLEQGARNLLQHVLVILALAGLDQLLDLGGEVRSDAGDFRQFAVRVARDVLQALGIALDAALGAVVGNRLELPLGVLLKDAQDRADFFKHSGDLAVSHVPLPASRNPRSKAEASFRTPNHGVRRYSMRGNGIVSRTCSRPQIQPTTRSMPMPKPA